MDFIEKLREAVKIPTWRAPGVPDDDPAGQAPLLRFQEFLAEQFPAFHKTAECWVLSPWSVVYHLTGEKPSGNSGDNSAVLFLAHYDVVPAETEKWSVDPFGAEMKDGFIYGRGSLDMKGTLISIMEAAENLCVQEKKPQRDIWFAFGGDEERTGILGAVETAKWFEKRGQRFAWILDEGTMIAENQIKGINIPIALVSVEEKGYVSFSLSVEQEPGHASRPPKVQAAAVLGRALCRLEKKNFPCRLSATVEAFFRDVSPLMAGIQGFVMRHARALGPLFFAAVKSNPTIVSMLRSTIAMTMLEGSAADNVLPSEVRAVINIRLLWPWTVEKAADFIRRAVNDERVKVNIYGLGTDPVAASLNYRQNGWKELQSAMEKAWPGIPMIPFIMVATTDSRHYQKLSEYIFRFSPHKLDPAELGGIHGHDERISLENLSRGLTFYKTLLETL